MTALTGIPTNNQARDARVSTKPRTGVAATEFALILPLILLLALACADFGRVLHHYQIVSNAARVGAEVGAMHGFTGFTQAAWEAGIREAVVEELEGLPGFNESSLDYQLTVTTDADDLATVQVEINYPFQSAISWPALPTLVPLRGMSKIRQFR